MKIKKMVVLLIISIILISTPIQILGWLQYTTYEVCNIINVIISWIMKIIAFVIGISYITIVIQYLKHSKEEKKQKTKNILTWLMVIIVEVIFLVSGAVWVKEIGMETYWSSGERYQFNETDGYIANGIRIIALISIIAYIATSVIYFVKSRQEKILKTENVIKWQVITSTFVGGLLILATRW